MANVIKCGIRLGAKTTNGLGEVISDDLVLQYYDFHNICDVKSWLLKHDGQCISIPQESVVQKNDLIINMECYFEETLLIKSIFEQAWETNGSLCIPGSSLKGVLRHHVRYILKKLHIDNYLERSLFGFSDENGESQKGDCVVSEVHLDRASIDSKQVQQTRIRIDRFTGGVINGALFQEHPLRNFQNHHTLFPIQITVKDCSKEAAGLFLLLVKDLMTGQITVGANRNIGSGRIRGKNVKIQYLNEHYDIDCNGKVIHGNKVNLEALLQSFLLLSKEAVNE